MRILFVVAEAEAGERLDRALAGLCGVSRAQVQRWIEADRVRCNDAPARATRRLACGDRLQAEPLESETLPSVPQPEPLPLRVLHEDAALIVLDKPAGLVVHPAPGHPRGTLVNALLHHCGALSGVGGLLRPGIVHRLDRGTSGVMVAAKTDAAHLALAAQFRDHSIERVYRAFVRGVPGDDAGCIARPLGRHPRDRKRMSVATRRGRAALTRWRVSRRFPGSEISELELRPETGRTHQLRVHLASIGLPILGDTVYGRRKRVRFRTRAASQLARPALHAAVLGFLHPQSGKPMRFDAPLAPELQELEAALEQQAQRARR